MITTKTKYLKPEFRSMTRKKTVFVFIVAEGTKVSTPSYWEGGSRSHWAKLVNGIPNTVRSQTAPSLFGGEPIMEAVNSDTVLLDNGIFRGKPAVLKLYTSNVANVFEDGIIHNNEFVADHIDDKEVINHLRGAIK